MLYVLPLPRKTHHISVLVTAIKINGTIKTCLVL